MAVMQWIVALTAFAVAAAPRPARGEQEIFENVQAPLTVKGQAFPSLVDASIDDLVSGLQSGLFTSVQLTAAYLGRIAQINGTLHAVTEANPDALQIADQLDLERSQGKIRGPLHGIPILIKNNIATADKMNNTAGSWALLGAKVPRDATVAKKLRDAGAVLLGKSNMSQWANFRSNNSSNGWSAYGGQVYGAYFPRQDPSGSSSGSAVAASVGLAAGCLGTETDGSIVSPSNRNNLVGIKPTVGLTSRALVIPISERQDTVGPMARTVKDAAYILAAIAGSDPADNYTLASPFFAGVPASGSNSSADKLPDYVAACKSTGLQGVRLGVTRDVMALYAPDGGVPETDQFEAALTVLRDLGATIVEQGTNFTGARQRMTSDAETVVLGADFVSGLAAYLAQLTTRPTSGVRTLADLRTWTQAAKNAAPEEFPARNTAAWDRALGIGLATGQLGGFNNSDPRFWPVYTQSAWFGDEGGLLGVLKKLDLDAIVMPTSFSSTWAATVGAPIVTVPMGFYPVDSPVRMNRRGDLVDTAPHIPVGISFLGAKWSEEKLIGMAYAYEQKTMARNRVQPYIIPNIEIGDFAGY